jgi:hypothetical protein
MSGMEGKAYGSRRRGGADMGRRLVDLTGQKPPACVGASSAMRPFGIGKTMRIFKQALAVTVEQMVELVRDGLAAAADQACHGGRVENGMPDRADHHRGRQAAEASRAIQFR